MVLLKLKGKAETDQFCFSTTLTEKVATVTEELAKIWNTRLRVKWFLTCGKDLVKECTDPELRPVPEPNAVKTLQRTLEEAEEYISLARSERRDPITLEGIEEHVRKIRGAVMILFPEEASNLDALAKAMESLEIDEKTRMRKQFINFIMEDQPSHMADIKELLDPSTAQLWTCGKELIRDKKLGECLAGSNEKSMCIVKLTSRGSGAPAREPVIDQKTQQDMMTFWHRKQEEEKRLEDDDDISYGNSQWADGKQLKSHFQGLGNVKLPPGRLA